MVDDKKTDKEAQKAKKKTEKEAKKAAKQDAKEAKKAEKNGNEKPAKSTKLTKGKKVPEKKDSKKLIKKILFGFIFILILGIGLFIGYYFLKSPNIYHKQSLDKINISEELVKFSFEHINRIYRGLVETNNRLSLIENEIERINQIEDDFPEQIPLTSVEISTWENLKIILTSLIENLEKNIEMYYVAYHVNTGKGIKLIESNEKQLAKSMDSTLESSDELIDRLKEQNKKRKGITETLKTLF